MLLCSGSSNQEVPWSGGKFYTVDKIMLWRENGELYIFKLPARAIRPVDHSDASWSAEPPTYLHRISTGPLMVYLSFSRITYCCFSRISIYCSNFKSIVDLGLLVVKSFQVAIMC